MNNLYSAARPMPMRKGSESSHFTSQLRIKCAEGLRVRFKRGATPEKGVACNLQRRHRAASNYAGPATRQLPVPAARTTIASKLQPLFAAMATADEYLFPCTERITTGGCPVCERLQGRRLISNYPQLGLFHTFEPVSWRNVVRATPSEPAGALPRRGRKGGGSM